MMTMTEFTATLVLLALLATSAQAVTGLQVKCDQDGAEVFLNGQKVGKCAMKDTLKAGKYTLEIRKNLSDQSYYYYSRKMTVVDGDTVKVGAVLEHVYPEAYWYGKAVSTTLIADWDEYLQRYPGGGHSDEARQKLAERAIRVEQERQEAIREGRIIVDCPDCPEMVPIPGRNVALGRTEVTQRQWQAVMGSNPSSFDQCGDACPVEQVSWNDAQEYIKKLSALSGKQYRLPTEVEWEDACLGGSKTEYCGGDNLDALGWYDVKTTRLVGLKKANGYGLYDMSGNVREWVQDCYDSACSKRVLRGGSWYLIATYARSVNRNYSSPDIRSSSNGLRVARTLP